jgi:hypothetical protein
MLADVSQEPIQNTEKVSQIILADSQSNRLFDDWKVEGMRNLRMLRGSILSTTDKTKLRNEGRPDFEYNLLLPLILQLGGNFKKSQSKLEAYPVTPDDQHITDIINPVLDYCLYQANDLPREMAKAYIDALVCRFGWVTQDWSYKKDDLGMLWLRKYDWRRMKFDPNFSEPDMSDASWIMDVGYYTPEELQMMFAVHNPELWDSIDGMSKVFLGEDTIKKGKIASFLDRFTGILKDYAGDAVGYDYRSEKDDKYLEDTNLWNERTGTFRTVEFHERRAEVRWIMTDIMGMETDITDQINGGMGYNDYDDEKMQMVTQQYNSQNIHREMKNMMYECTVVPAFNKVLQERPYDVQKNMFKYTPVTCFDFGSEPLEFKSYVDHLKDPLSSYNLRRNTILTILMRSAHSEVWYEEDALGKYEDDLPEMK